MSNSDWINDAIFILQDGKIKFFNNRAKLIGIELGIDLDWVAFDQYMPTIRISDPEYPAVVNLAIPRPSYPAQR